MAEIVFLSDSSGLSPRETKEGAFCVIISPVTGDKEAGGGGRRGLAAYCRQPLKLPVNE
jgi:hypothetical protein